MPVPHIPQQVFSRNGRKKRAHKPKSVRKIKRRNHLCPVCNRKGRKDNLRGHLRRRHKITDGEKISAVLKDAILADD